ncbi:MAG: DUF1501 domain-containing protein [Planctomycetes bacterium]|nr:DUF1501 domain-containing protein [Planctomycetota bacterium]
MDPLNTLSRRALLARAACGFGSVALTSLVTDRDSRASALPDRRRLAGLDHVPRARNVIFLYMDGGPSQVDTWDPKPLLQRDSGKPFPLAMEPTQFDNNGNTLGSPWKFARHGESGIEVSELFPHIASCVDRLALIRSMTADFPEHTNANYFLHTGHGLQGRPSMGAWFGYGLGTENQDLPGYVVLHGGLIPPGGIDNFLSGFLPASYQASILRPAKMPIANVDPKAIDFDAQASQLALMQRLDAKLVERTGRIDALEAAIHNYELAARMQLAVPELADVESEPESVRKLYGFEAEYDKTRVYARQCLLARRLIERGVRFVELTCPDCGYDRWDQHSRLKAGHGANARAIDQPIAALLTDLERRGMLDETLVVWSGEFGRTPFAQGTNGRDHNPYGFSLWMAGGGIRGGTVYGATDDYGYKAVENRVTIHDLHATMLHLLGIDHEKLTYRHSGRDIRLTDVAGEIIHDVIA